MQSVWIWDTEVFNVRVLGDVRSCYYVITDKISDPDRHQTLADGQTASFHQAENRIREIIGKAYTEEHGYRKYAGYLATTFTIADGQRVDFGPYEGEQVTVEVFTSKDTTTAITGELRIEHHYLSILKGSTNINIRPTHVKCLTLLNSIKQERVCRFEKINGRTYRATWEHGCTGEAGFLPNTVDHRGLVCPVHER